MLVESQVLEVLKSKGLSLEQLEYMVIRSAVFTHEWANRRYHGWLFDVDLGLPIHVYRMRLDPNSLDRN